MADSLLNSDPAYLLSNYIHPFLPEGNIFNGGYIGPLAPCPSHLAEPEKGLDLYRTLDQPNNPFELTSNYIPNFLTNPYLGLGPFNPSIYYTNLSHMVNIFDTFMRMSYGVGFMVAAKDFSQTITPAIDLSLSLSRQVAEGGAPQTVVFNKDTIYPGWSEVPSDFINRMILDENPITGEKVVGIRPTGLHFSNFDPLSDGGASSWYDGEFKDAGITMPGTNFIAFINILLFSYRTLIPELRLAFIELADFIQTNLHQQRSEHELADLDGQPADVLETIRFHRADQPWTEEDDSRIPRDRINTGFDQPLNLLISAAPVFLTTLNRGEAATTYQWVGATVPQALQVMWGDPAFHQRGDPTEPGAPWEHRSLHENLAIVNVLPITLSDTMWSYAVNLEEDAPNFGVNAIHRHTTVVDFLVHTRVPQTIQFTWDCHAENVLQNIGFLRIPAVSSWSASLYWSYTNRFSFDPAWFDREIVEDSNKTIQTDAAFNGDPDGGTFEDYWEARGLGFYDTGLQIRDFNLTDSLLVPDTGDIFAIRCRAVFNTFQNSQGDRDRQYNHDVSFNVAGTDWNFSTDFSKTGEVLPGRTPL